MSQKHLVKTLRASISDYQYIYTSASLLKAFNLQTEEMVTTTCNKGYVFKTATEFIYTDDSDDSIITRTLYFEKEPSLLQL